VPELGLPIPSWACPAVAGSLPGNGTNVMVMVRLKEIAALANCSVMTVSKALRDKPDVSPATKARIKAIARQMGYVPNSSAKMLRTKSSRLFGVVISSPTNPIFSRVLLAIEERSHHLGYDLLLDYTHDDPEREEHAIRRMLSRGVEGLFLAPVYRIATEARIYKDQAARGVPTIIMGHTASFCSNLPSVACDDLHAAYALTKHLLGLGHRRIAFLCGPPGTPWTTERFEGYRRALREDGLEVDDALVFQAGRTIENGREAAEQILAEAPNATAIQATNDMVAIGCVDVLSSHGCNTPGDVSVTGFGNTLVSGHFRVPLTTTNQPKYRLGMAAMDSMVQLLGGKHPVTKRIEAELIVRASTGIPPASIGPGRQKAAPGAIEAL
jgi:DNA-binding LacI/PurR family transcriptional regulator